MALVERDRCNTLFFPYNTHVAMLVSLSQTSISSPDHKESPTIYPNPLSTGN